MKRIIVMICLLFAGYAMADGAFGTYKGMTRKQLEKKGIIFIKENPNGSIVSNNAPIQNPLITEYVYHFDNKGGLCTVKGLSIPTYTKENPNNLPQLKKAYESLEKAMLNKYGSPDVEVNKVKNKFRNDWIYGTLKDNDKDNYTLNNTPIPTEYVKLWKVKNKFLVMLYPVLTRTVKYNYGGGAVLLVYGFPNCKNQETNNSKGL